jgi:very-short-patch-repair endonuclease
MSKEEQLLFCEKIKQYYSCKIILNDIEPYTLFCARDFGDILGIKNISDSLQGCNDKVKIKTLTKMGYQNMTYITYNVIIKNLMKSRKVNVIDFSNKLGIKIENKIFTCIEADTLKCIVDSFNGEEILFQYNILNYLIDMYFPKYKLIIECDEDGHNIFSNKKKDLEREQNIKNLINDVVFIRYNPLSKDFNIFNVINKIFKHIHYNS